MGQQNKIMAYRRKAKRKMDITYNKNNTSRRRDRKKKIIFFFQGTIVTRKREKNNTMFNCSQCLTNSVASIFVSAAAAAASLAVVDFMNSISAASFK